MGAGRRAAREGSSGVVVEPSDQAHDPLGQTRRERARDDGRDHLGEGDEIVTRRPAAELEQLGGQEGLAVEHFEHAPQLAGGRCDREAGHHPDAGLAPKWDAHAHARCQIVKRVGNAVGEEIVQRHGWDRRNLDEPLHAESYS